MAASDPTPYVATPTGTLQGVAAFSWDGSAWQPSGRAGPDVATPTGVLQGVAPFSWDGANWQPSGRAQPGVATPAGVLDGVAVYTWSGSAWTPTGGTATPSTSTGALRGVAAFGWDGAAWQPAAQARASVPTPYGVLAGVAFFNWSGTTWAAGAAAVPSGATLDLSFLSGGTLDPRITFTRASTATYFDSSGTMQTAASGAPRFDYDPVTHALRGVWVEEARTNQLFPSVPDTTVWTNGAVTVTMGAAAAPDGTAAVTQVAETVANALHFVMRSPMATTSLGPQTLSVYARAAGTRYLQVSLDDSGSGTIGGYATFDLQSGVISGALTAKSTATVGTATIQAAGNGFYRCSITVTTTGASLSDRIMLILSNAAAPAFGPTYAGNAANGVLLWGVLLEIGAFPTSYIPTTAATATRAAEVMSLTDAALFLGANGKTIQVEALAVQNMLSTQDGYWLDLHDVGATNLLQLITPPTSTGIRSVVFQSPTTYINGADVALTRPTVFKAAIANSTVWNSAVNGALTPGSGGASAIGTGAYTALHMGCGSTAIGGYIRRVRFWQRALSQAELQAVTT